MKQNDCFECCSYISWVIVCYLSIKRSNSVFHTNQITSISKHKCSFKIQVVCEGIISNVQLIHWQRVRTVWWLSLASFVVLHSLLVPLLQARMDEPCSRNWQMRDDISIVDHSVSFRDLRGIVVSKLLVSYSAGSKSIDGVGKLIDLLEIYCCQDCEGSSQTVSSHDDPCASVDSVETLDWAKYWGFNGLIKFVEAFWDLAVGASIIGDSCGFDVLDKSVDIVCTLKADNNGAKWRGVACEASNSCRDVEESFGTVDFVLLAVFAVPGINCYNTLISDGWHVSHLKCDRSRVGSFGWVDEA